MYIENGLLQVCRPDFLEPRVIEKVSGNKNISKVKWRKYIKMTFLKSKASSVTSGKWKPFEPGSGHEALLFHNIQEKRQKSLKRAKIS